MKKQGFIYLWYDTKRKLFYLGSHKGTTDDGYVGSNKRLMCAYKSRPETFKRKILEYVEFDEYSELTDKENKWLSMIKLEELHRVKYYNEKRVACGGDIISTLSKEKREQHKQKSIAARKTGWYKWNNSLTPDERTNRARYAKSCVKNPSGGSMPGESNPFYGKRHTTQARKKISIANRKRKYPARLNLYTVTYENGIQEEFSGLKSIEDKYKYHPHKFKLSRYIKENRPIQSNRKSAKDHPLLGAIITQKNFYDKTNI